MTTHSSILARRIPWAEEPSGLQSDWTIQSSDTQMHTHRHMCAQTAHIKNTQVCKHTHMNRELSPAHTSPVHMHAHVQTQTPTPVKETDISIYRFISTDTATFGTL